MTLVERVRYWWLCLQVERRDNLLRAATYKAERRRAELSIARTRLARQQRRERT